MKSQRRRWFLACCAAWLVAVASLGSMPAAAASLTFTLAASEAVQVTGTPRIAIDVGGTIRYATYVAGSGTNSLTFSYPVAAGDFDANGISVAGPLELAGGALADLAGNPASLSFTPPVTTDIKVQAYRPAFTTAITSANAAAVGFTIPGAPTGTGYSYSYTISGANGGSLSAGPTPYSGNVSVTGLDLSAWPAGDVTLTVRIDGPSGAGTPVSITVSPTFTQRPLDNLPSAASAYSVRQLRSAYSGPLMRVRRASDDAQRNIGATQAGALDTAALVDFCGSSTCFVTTWHDQSGNGNDAIQATPANQPRIVNNGTIEKNGKGRTALRTLTVGSVLNAGPPMATSAEFTIVMSLQTASYAYQWAWGMTSWPGQVSSNCPWSDGICYFDVGGISGPARILAPSGVSPGVPYVATFANSVSASTQFTRINGTQIASDTTGHSVALQALSIMNNYEFNGVRNNLGQIGTVSEFVIFPSLLSATERNALESDMMQVHGP